MSPTSASLGLKIHELAMEVYRNIDEVFMDFPGSHVSLQQGKFWGSLLDISAHIRFSRLLDCVLWSVFCTKSLSKLSLAKASSILAVQLKA